MTEQSAPDTDFLAEVCKQWEAACQPARDAGIPVTNIRIGVVLSPDGGALAKMLTPFKLGLGGKIGNGEQYMSWIALDDLVGAIVYLLAPRRTGRRPGERRRPEPGDQPRLHQNPRPRPRPARRSSRCRRSPPGSPSAKWPTRCSSPAPASPRKRVSASGYQFQYPELEPALRHLLRQMNSTRRRGSAPSAQNHCATP